MLERTVVRLLCFGREAAAGKLAILQVVLKTFATSTTTGTSSVGAGAKFEILLFAIIHVRSSAKGL